MRPPGIQTKAPNKSPGLQKIGRTIQSQQTPLKKQLNLPVDSQNEQSETDSENETKSNNAGEFQGDNTEQTTEQLVTNNLVKSNNLGKESWQEVVKVVVAAQIKTFKSLNLCGLGNSTISVGSKLAQFPENKLKSCKNYKAWKQILDINLESLRYHNCVYIENKMPKEI